MRKVQWGFRQLIIASLMIFITCNTNNVYAEENKQKLDVLFIALIIQALYLLKIKLKE